MNRQLFNVEKKYYNMLVDPFNCKQFVSPMSQQTQSSTFIKIKMKHTWKVFNKFNLYAVNCFDVYQNGIASNQGAAGNDLAIHPAIYVWSNPATQTDGTSFSTTEDTIQRTVITTQSRVRDVTTLTNMDVANPLPSANFNQHRIIAMGISYIDSTNRENGSSIIHGIGYIYEEVVQNNSKTGFWTAMNMPLFASSLYNGLWSSSVNNIYNSEIKVTGKGPVTSNIHPTGTFFWKPRKMSDFTFNKGGNLYQDIMFGVFGLCTVKASNVDPENFVVQVCVIVECKGAMNDSPTCAECLDECGVFNVLSNLQGKSWNLDNSLNIPLDI